jgi:hypothetical protein
VWNGWGCLQDFLGDPAYLNGGIRTFVLDIPQEPDDLHHARIAIERAVAAMDGGAS